MASLEQGAAWIEDALVPIDEARLPILDWGFLHSDATYDVAHVWRGRFFRLDAHIERFLASMAALRLELPFDRAVLRERLHELVAATGLRDAYVEMICTRGEPAPGSRDPRTCRNRFLAFAVPFIRIADEAQQARGLHLVVSGWQRIPPESVDPAVKNYHWLDMVRALFEAYDRGGETAATVDARGNVVEGPGFNVFTVSEGRLTTPAAGVLPGVTRRTVMELAAARGHAVHTGPLPARSLREADEVFLTSTAGGVMPVTRVDDRPVGEGVPGPVTLALRRAYWDLHADDAHADPVDYGPQRSPGG